MSSLDYVGYQKKGADPDIFLCRIESIADHRLDESPAGYSSAGWSPPAPASTSPTDDDSGGDEVV
jgi:hypothetical protein